MNKNLKEYYEVGVITLLAVGIGLASYYSPSKKVNNIEKIQKEYVSPYENKLKDNKIEEVLKIKDKEYFLKNKIDSLNDK